MGTASSQKTVGSDGSSIKEDIKVENNLQSIAPPPEHNCEPSCSHLLESAPFPALGSLHEITRALSHQTHNSNVNDGEKTIAPPELEQEKKPWQQPLDTEGWRNPGWCAVAAAFLVNFVVFGNSFSWGNFQKL